MNSIASEYDKEWPKSCRAITLSVATNGVNCQMKGSHSLNDKQMTAFKSHTVNVTKLYELSKKNTAGT
jgi:hypothetical protein